MGVIRCLGRFQKAQDAPPPCYDAEIRSKPPRPLREPPGFSRIGLAQTSEMGLGRKLRCSVLNPAKQSSQEWPTMFGVRGAGGAVFTHRHLVLLATSKNYPSLKHNGAN
jgi:hypothetical protein